MKNSADDYGSGIILTAHSILSVTFAGLFSAIGKIFLEDTHFWYTFIGFLLYFGGNIPSVLFKEINFESRNTFFSLGMLAIVVGAVLLASSGKQTTIIDWLFVLCLVAYGFKTNKKNLQS